MGMIRIYKMYSGDTHNSCFNMHMLEFRETRRRISKIRNMEGGIK